MKEKHPLTFQDNVSCCTYHGMHDSVVDCLSIMDIVSIFSA